MYNFNLLEAIYTCIRLVPVVDYPSSTVLNLQCKHKNHDYNYINFMAYLELQEDYRIGEVCTINFTYRGIGLNTSGFETHAFQCSPYLR